jgi:hypothetical protein
VDDRSVTLIGAAACPAEADATGREGADCGEGDASPGSDWAASAASADDRALVWNQGRWR